MIISHSRKFIFVKTFKTASTSLEIVLSRHCGPQDVLTPLMPEDERERRRIAGTGAQNYWRPLREYPTVERLRRLATRRREFKFAEHLPAWQIRRRVGEEIWSSYFKFAVIRNPFDRCVSHYYFARGLFDQIGAFELWDRRSVGQFLRYMPAQINENWRMYTTKDEIMLDRLVRYENLEEDLADVSRRIGLPGNLYDEMKSIHTKAGYRPKDARPRDLLEERDRQLTALLCSKEIEAFGYRFEDGPAESAALAGSPA